MQAAIALYKACGYQEESQEAANDMPRNGGSLLGEASNLLQFSLVSAEDMHVKVLAVYRKASEW